MNLYFVRHGATGHNQGGVWQGAELNSTLAPEGFAQARAAARGLSRFPIRRVVSSDLARAVQTAEIVASALGVPHTTDPLWREIRLGVWSGLTREAALAACPHLSQADAALIDDAPPGGESQLQLVARARLALDAVLALGLPDIAVVTHGALLRALLCDLLHIPLERRKAITHANGGVTILQEKDGFYFVRCINTVYGE